jgi:hypothetical protein
MIDYRLTGFFFFVSVNGCTFCPALAWKAANPSAAFLAFASASASIRAISLPYLQLLHTDNE